MADHEITCIRKTDRTEVNEKIKSFGGIDLADGKRWKLSQADAIKAVESAKARFYVTLNGKRTAVVVAVNSWGNKYLKCEADREQPTTLLNLPECPFF